MILLLFCSFLQDPPLSKADATLLDAPFAEGLFDPVATKAERIRGKVEIRTCYGKKNLVEASGWLIPTEGADRPRMLLDSLQEVLAPENRKSMDPAKDAFSGEFPVPSLSDLGIFRNREMHDFLWAAWLHRLGKDTEAAGLLRRVKPDEILKRFREAVAWKLLDSSLNAFLVRDDEDALRATEQLVKLESPYLKQGKLLLADLKRRKAGLHFGKAPPSLPDEFPSWPWERRIAVLIERLDEIQALRSVDLDIDRNPIFSELCEVGEAAVPALVRCIEEDDRLFRAMGVWREWSPSRNLWPVRDLAYGALQVILKTEFVDPSNLTPKLSLEKPEEIKKTAAYIRTYWEKQSKFPFPARMMAVLADPDAKPLAWQEAAVNLGNLGRRRAFNMWGWLPATSKRRPGILPELATFERPTAAEAILLAFDRHMDAFDKRGKEVSFYGVDPLENAYLESLAAVNDARLAPELKRRYEKLANVRIRRKLAFCMHRLGENGPIDDFARDFARGRIVLPANDRPEPAGNMQGAFQPGNLELKGIVESLSGARTSACEEALDALTQVRHPQYSLVAERLNYCTPTRFDDRAWFGHTYCLKVLARRLEDLERTGVSMTIERGYVVWRTNDSRGELEIPEIIREEADRKPQADLRKCDAAADQLNQLVIGLPEYHPLFKSAQERLSRISAAMKRFEGRFRLLKAPEVDALGLDPDQAHFVPDIHPLKEKANEEDVGKGRALFFVKGPSTAVSESVPAVATVKATGSVVLILQIEKLPNGRHRYGGVARNSMGDYAEEEMGPLQLMSDERR